MARSAGLKGRNTLAQANGLGLGPRLRPCRRQTALALLAVAFLLALGAPSAFAVREPDALVMVDGWPCVVVALEEPAATRALVVAIRAESETEAGAWANALPSWRERNRSAIEDGLWQFAFVEPVLAGAAKGPNASEVLACLRGELDLPSPGDAPMALLLAEIPRRDLAALGIAKPNPEQAARARAALGDFRRSAPTIHPGALLLDAAGRYGDKTALELRGPAWGTPHSAVFALQCAQIGLALAPEGIARLRVEPDAPRLVVYDATGAAANDPVRWVDATLADAAAAIASTPWPGDFDLLRDRVRLLRERNFESPGTRLDFLSRRLAALPPEIAFAEDRLLDAASPDQWRAAARIAFNAPLWQAWLPTERPSTGDEIAGAPDAEESAPLVFQTRRFYTLVHRETDAPIASVCLLVGLPGTLEPAGPPLREARWFGGERTVEARGVTRAQAAELWWILAAGNRAFTGADGRRLDAFLPSPLPGAGSDPFGANQYSGVALQAESRNVGELIHVAAEFLARPPSLAFGLSPIDRRQLEGTPEWAASLAALADQRRLMAGTTAETIFAAQADALHALDEPERAFATLFNPANLVIAVSAPVDAEAVAAYFDRAMEPLMGSGPAGANHQRPRLAAAWPRPVAKPADAPLPAPRRWWGVVDSSEPEAHAATLLLGPALSGSMRLRGRADWTFATLEFPGFLLLYGAAPNDWTSAASRDADLLAIRESLRGLADMAPAALSPAIEELRSVALRSRALRDAQSIRRSFSLARNALMRGDPLYSDAVDAALAAATAEEVATLAKGLAEGE